MTSGDGALDFPDKDLPLRSDVSTLGALLGEILRSQEPGPLYERVEKVRLAARRRRRGDESATSELESLLQGRPAEEAEEIVRAFSAYFFLVNMAERVHRIRRRIDYLRAGEVQPGSWGAVFKHLKSQGVELQDVQAALAGMRIEPVFTAHPTEAMRRTLLIKEQRIARALVDRIAPEFLLEAEQKSALARIRGDVVTAWQTEENLAAKPTVADEVEHVLFYISEVIYRIVPRFYEDLEAAFQSVYGEHAKLPPGGPKVRFASWVGGDMDGNPNVGPQTIRETLERHLALITRRYRSEVQELFQYLSQSTSRVGVSEAVLARNEEYQQRLPAAWSQVSPRYHDMPYRVLLSFIDARLEMKSQGDEELGYGQPEELLEDLRLIVESLRGNRGEDAGMFLVERLMRRVEVFGFHLATLDVRQDALIHRRVVGELLAVDGFEDKPAAERLALIEAALKTSDEPFGEFSDEAERALEVMRSLGRARELYGEEAVGPYIISMAQGPDDALAVLLIAKAAGLVVRVGGREEVPLDIAPLFETVDDLRGGPATLQALLEHPVYREHVERRGHRQVIMLGYSDSNKESGMAASRWALYEAQAELVATSRKAGVELQLFHGRGGTASRGGTQPRAGILAAPPASVRGRLRVTEQGEIIHAKFGLRGIAIRTLELTGGAVLEHSLLSEAAPPPSEAWIELARSLSRESRRSYRELVRADEGFYTYFREATPIDVIERLTIGSRPASRRKQRGIEDLRAIPWVFSWTQSRHVLTGWYGVGTGLALIENEAGIATLREMHRRWPFFQTLVSDVEMVLAKADMPIAKRYAALCPSEGERVYSIIQREFDLTCEMVRRIQGEASLLTHDSVLQRAIRLRNPYVDPMSLVQVDLLARWRETDREDKALEQVLFTTVRGIARGLQNTG